MEALQLRGALRRRAPNLREAGERRPRVLRLPALPLGPPLQLLHVVLSREGPLAITQGSGLRPEDAAIEPAKQWRLEMERAQETDIGLRVRWDA